MTRSSSTGRCRKSTGSLVLLFILLSLIFVHGSAKTGYRKKPYPRKKKGSRTTSPPIAYNGSYYGDSNIFDVLSYGAKGDGTTDDSKAFLAAWKAACRVESAVVEVPAEFCFLLNPISFVGPCQPNIVFQIDGAIIAPTNLAYGVQAYCSGFSSKNSKALPFREMALLMDREQLGGGLRGIIWGALPLGLAASQAIPMFYMVLLSEGLIRMTILQMRETTMRRQSQPPTKMALLWVSWPGFMLVVA